MKIAVSATGQDVESEVDPRFGRAPYFVVVDSETKAVDVVENTQNLNLPQGAGIQAGKTIVNSGANVLLTGNCGPKAFAVLEQAGISVVIGAKGKVSEAVSAYLNGDMATANGPNVDGHWV
ncbi:MAG: NifB/NifX family molybdenum-iron cluster-binding protein [Thermodesulfobacteriota bacterium]|nr:NifB/NifX family molybdenum-iron cluster-binding protein [Thermodesulfobacteriota bacterium]